MSSDSEAKSFQREPKSRKLLENTIVTFNPYKFIRESFFFALLENSIEQHFLLSYN